MAIVLGCTTEMHDTWTVGCHPEMAFGKQISVGNSSVLKAASRDRELLAGGRSVLRGRNVVRELNALVVWGTFLPVASWAIVKHQAALHPSRSLE